VFAGVDELAKSCIRTDFNLFEPRLSCTRNLKNSYLYLYYHVCQNIVNKNMSSFVNNNKKVDMHGALEKSKIPNLYLWFVISKMIRNQEWETGKSMFIKIYRSRVFVKIVLFDNSIIMYSHNSVLH
jgi:hypothetical protein